MPYLVGLIWGGFGQVLKNLVGRVLVALGISYVTYQGVDALISGLKASALENFANIPPEILGIIGLARIGESLSVIISALAAKYALQGLTRSFTKMAIK